MKIARGAVLNLLGHAAPLLAALAIVPPLVAGLGPDRFGFLSLAWVLVGYFSLFDLGLGRALSRLVAERSGTPREVELPRLSRCALALTFALGVLAGIFVFAAAGPICVRLLNVPAELRAEAVTALRILALCLPLVTLSAALRGLLEAGQRFGWVNAIRIPLGILTFVAPLMANAVSPGLVGLAMSLALLRVAALAAHWYGCARLFPTLVGIDLPQIAAAREILGYGAWLTVSNIVGPLMVYLDRFVIGALLALSAVAYYAAPYEVVTRLWVVPAALTGVLFPAFAASGAELLRARYRTGVKAILVTIFPVTLLAALFAPEWLGAWLGNEYAAQGAFVAQVLCAGVLFNSLAYLPFTLLQAKGHAGLVAKTHLAELPVYLALLALLVTSYGINGAALAWSTRCVADALALYALARRRVLDGAGVLSRTQNLVAGLALLGFLGAFWPGTLAGRSAYALGMALVFVPLLWRVLLDPEDRAMARRTLAWLRGAPEQ